MAQSSDYPWVLETIDMERGWYDKPTTWTRLHYWTGDNLLCADFPYPGQMLDAIAATPNSKKSRCIICKNKYGLRQAVDNLLGD